MILTKTQFCFCALTLTATFAMEMPQQIHIDGPEGKGFISKGTSYNGTYSLMGQSNSDGIARYEYAIVKNTGHPDASSAPLKIN